MKKFISILSILILSLPFIGNAHPGHGETGGFTITHYFTEPMHVIISVILLSAVVIYIRHLLGNKQQKQKG